jgi:hypothetical protein
MMTLNNRELIFSTYSTEKNWEKDLPKENWLCIVVDNDRPRQYIDEVISKIIENDVCWVLSIGQSCELIHDLVDEEIVCRQVDIDDRYLPKHEIMTTWHRDFDEGIWFGIFAANDEDVQIDKVLILDMTAGEERQRITKLIDSFNEGAPKNNH